MTAPNTPTPGLSDSLGSMLAAESAWSPREGAKAPELWEAALGRTRPVSRNFSWSSVGTIAAIVCVGTVLIGVLLPNLGKARSVRLSKDLAPPSPPAASYKAEELDRAAGMSSAVNYESYRRANGLIDADGKHGEFLDQARGGSGVFAATVNPKLADVPAPSDPAPIRQVIRKSQLSLTVDDVRAAFLQINDMILSEAGGEYIQDSSLTGQDSDKKNQTATLTLRVAVARLGAVLTKLRALGNVATEASGGEDVTDQMVDLEARLRNEQRVETELLSLLETRRGSPLNEILSLRQSIDSSRERIERLMAQRDRLSRLVALATVNVIIRHKDADKVAVAQPEAPPTFIDKLGASFERGGDSLLRSVAWLIEVAIGGLLGWLFLAAIIVGALDIRRRLLRRAAVEPPPAA